MENQDRTINILGVIIFTAMLGLGILGPILPIYAKDLGASMTQIGLLTSAWSLSRLIFTAPMGSYADKNSKKRVIIIGLAIYSIVSVFYAFSWNITSLIAVRILHGMGSAMALPVATAYGAEIAPRGKEGQYMGILNLAMMAGFAFGPFLGGTLTDIASKEIAFYTMAGLTGISLLLAIFFLPDVEFSTGKKKAGSFKQIFANPELTTMIWYSFVSTLAIASIFGFLSMYLSQPVSAGGMELPIATIGLVLSVGQFISASLQKEFGKLADKYDKRKIIIASGLIGAAGILIFPLMTNTTGIFVSQLIFICGLTLGSPAINAVVAIAGREIGTGTAISALQSSNSLGNIIGPLAAGMLLDRFGFTIIFYLCGAIMIISVAMFYFRTRGKELTSA
jgi:DHA1 family multidrug resistance protein-like MFS transporter